MARRRQSTEGEGKPAANGNGADPGFRADPLTANLRFSAIALHGIDHHLRSRLGQHGRHVENHGLRPARPGVKNLHDQDFH